MTRKDYQLIAGVLAIARDEMPHRTDTIDAIIRRLAAALEMENDRFDADIFYRAAGMPYA